MPFLLLGGAALLGSLFTGIGAGINNATEPTKNVQTPENVAASAFPQGLKWVVIIAGSVLAIKYGTKLLKKV